MKHRELFRPHPWHGLSPGPNPPSVVTVFVEMTPFDHVKYEADKETGFLCVDRPQRATSRLPAMYGFIPRTYCADRVAKLAGHDEGDHDPLDVCVLSERSIEKSEILLQARVVGGLRFIDRGEVDDKIVAVLDNDLLWGGTERLSDLPDVTVERLKHYFLTYKMIPGQENPMSGGDEYDAEDAWEVVRASIADYEDAFGDDTAS